MVIVPVVKNDKGEDWGTNNQQLATWCLSRGYDVEMHTADFQIIDQSWASLDREQQLARMEAARDHRLIPSLGKEWSGRYMQSYSDFVQANGELHIEPYMTVELLDRLLPVSPVFVCVCANVLNGWGRTINVGLRESKQDDIHGALVNHSIVVYGKDDAGKYLIADPWTQPGLRTIEPELLLAAMAASQIECDNLLFQLKK